MTEGFVWFHNSSENPVQSSTFYQKLLGWRASDGPGGLTMPIRLVLAENIQHVVSERVPPDLVTDGPAGRGQVVISHGPDVVPPPFQRREDGCGPGKVQNQRFVDKVVQPAADDAGVFYVNGQIRRGGQAGGLHYAFL